MDVLLIADCGNLVGLLIAEWHGMQRLRVFTKVLCSACFCVAGTLAIQSADAFSILLIAGFGTSFVGDVLLLFRQKRAFLLGLGFFLLAHVFYAAAFGVFGADFSVVVPTFLVLALFSLGVLRWLWSSLNGLMRLSVVAYIAAISVMVAMAIGTKDPLLGCAALSFMVSDLAVARERFVSSSVWNKLWGLPLYFAAQWGFVFVLFEACSVNAQGKFAG